MMRDVKTLPLTPERLREVLDYDPETGAFKRRETPAGNVTSQGYIVIKVDQITYSAHRLAWLFVHGEWPEYFLDHIDGDKGNNKIENLRPATNGQNKAAQGPQSNNKLGLKGVSRRGDGFVAQIKSGQKKRWLGRFATAEAASAAYEAAAREMHGDFAFVIPPHTEGSAR